MKERGIDRQGYYQTDKDGRKWRELDFFHGQAVTNSPDLDAFRMANRMRVEERSDTPRMPSKRDTSGRR